MKQAKIELKGCKKESFVRFERAMCQASISYRSVADIRGLEAGYPKLFDQNNYDQSNLFGRWALESGAEGILTNSVRAEGNCFVVFKPEVILSSKVVAFAAVTIWNDSKINVKVEKEELWFEIPEKSTARRNGQSET